MNIDSYTLMTLVQHTLIFCHNFLAKTVQNGGENIYLLYYYQIQF